MKLGLKLFRGLPAKLCAFGVLGLAAALLAFPEEIKTGVGQSILYCLTVLAPSLFPFMALVSFTVNSGAGETLGNCFGWLTRRLFRLPEVCTAPILMSFFGGYPAGARGTSLLLEQGKITKQQAGRMMLFCVNPGTAFVVTFLGGGVLGSFRTGWILFFSVTFAGLLLGVLSGLKFPVPQKSSCARTQPAQGTLIRSVNDASRSVLTMCACIVLFSGFSVILHSAHIFQFLCRTASGLGVFTPGEAASFLSFLLEVTGGAGTAASFHAGPALYAFGLAFGGLCVHLQVFSCFKAFPTPYGKFFLFRFLHGFLAAICCIPLAKAFPGDFVEALATAGEVRRISALSGTLAGGLSLLLMCMAFLLITTKEEPRDKKTTDKKPL